VADADMRVLDLPRWAIASGRYAVSKIADWERHRDAIGPTAAALRRNTTRPLAV